MARCLRSMKAAGGGSGAWCGPPVLAGLLVRLRARPVAPTQTQQASRALPRKSQGRAFNPDTWYVRKLCQYSSSLAPSAPGNSRRHRDPPQIPRAPAATSPPATRPRISRPVNLSSPRCSAAPVPAPGPRAAPARSRPTWPRTASSPKGPSHQEPVCPGGCPARGVLRAVIMYHPPAGRAAGATQGAPPPWAASVVPGGARPARPA